MNFHGPKITSLRLAAFLFVVASVDLACGSVSPQSGDAGNVGSAGTTSGGAATAGTSGGAGTAPTHGSNDGGAGSSDAAGAHGGADGGAGSGAAGKDGGGACLCTEIYSPVCGVDGKDYANACNAACAGVAVAHTGGCVTASDGGADGSAPLGYCDQASDCTTRSAGGCSCSQLCVAKTDPIPAPPKYTCGNVCPLIAVACGCVNHQCTAGAATAASP